MTDQVDISTPATETAPAKSNLVKRVAAALFLSAEGVPPMKVGKYPMPVKAPRYPLGINGVECQAAETSFKDLKYTYFQFNGVDFWVTGHLDKGLEYTFAFPEGYEFVPVKVDRKAQAAAAATKAKAKKAEGADTGSASEESALGAANAAGEGEGTSTGSDAPPAVVTKGKKAKR
jgi:hypothetical protein